MLVTANGYCSPDKDPPYKGAQRHFLQPDHRETYGSRYNVDQHGDGERAQQQPAEPHEHSLYRVERLPFQVPLCA